MTKRKLAVKKESSHPVIDRNIDFIKSHLETHTLFWISKQIKININSMYRYAERYGWKGLPMRQALSIEWDDKMLRVLKSKFATTFNRQLANECGVSMRSLIRKARELGLEKEEGFLDKNRQVISQMAKEALPKVSKETVDFITKAGIPYRFQKGNKPKNIDYKKVWETRRRNEQEIRMGLINPY